MTARAEYPESALGATSDRRRVEELFVRLEVRLTNVVYRWLWNREEVRDVVQEAFVRLWQMRERVDWERAEPLVYRIALNLASKRRRWSRVWQFVALTDREPETEPDADLARDESVRRAIDALPERQRRVLVMTMHSEMTYDEIGETLGISAGTVASRRNSAIHKLRGMLKRGSDD
ncbi:MAG TPA: sigma-70 family RNA polymerase sigma factor [Kofleriaceae bacterium]|nr:sigma-70 family RNA polymerase sigma factor [Kofleriaceae bacterium]